MPPALFRPPNRHTVLRLNSDPRLPNPPHVAWARQRFVWRWLGPAFIAILPLQLVAAPSLRFEVTLEPGLTNFSLQGRLFVLLGREESVEPRKLLGQPGPNAPFAFARDVKIFPRRAPAIVDRTAFGFPLTNLAALPPGEYVVQALFDSSFDLRLPNAPGNRYSAPRKVQFPAPRSQTITLSLTEQVPEERPQETEFLKFLKIQSLVLSQFHGRPFFLRAGVILPRDFWTEPDRHYPLWIRIGGYGTRYTGVERLMTPDSEFRRVWLADQTPRFILLQLDGAGPYGDPYYVNSENNGPYGDALVRELIPRVEAAFRGLGTPRSRVLSGASTGGWVSLALQVFYPDFFNGAWSSCPDPVDFRAYELINVYEDTNAFFNRYGNERPSERNLNGDIVLTVRREVAMENLLGGNNRYTMSGEQWGAWNAVFSPRGPDGRPVPLWNPRTGEIDPDVAEQWKKYDLRLVLEKNWKTLGPRLRGKLHIAVGESDQYFLNKAVHLLDGFLSHANPPFEGRITYGPGKGHGWFDLSLPQMLEEMEKATRHDPLTPQ
jgi:S-formylglutathione hydrolase FrmB